MEGIFPHGFEQLIAWRTGLQMREGDREKWRGVITERASSLRLQSLSEYYNLLTSDTDRGRGEWSKILGTLTTGESYFFRDKGQFSLLKNLILPDVIRHRQKDGTLRIWSAGCSTGEEPYSIAILLDEMIEQLKGWDIHILGTDINEKAIDKANEGLYTQWSFRATDPDLRKRYFKRRLDTWDLDEKIRQMVKFRTGNLVENSFPDKASDLQDMDIILCRNVFIYFNSVSVAVVLDKFIEALKDGGWLITGHGELFGQNLGRLQAKMFPESVAYQKKNAEDRAPSAELKETERDKITEVEKLRSCEVKEAKFAASQFPGFATSKPEIPKLPAPDSGLENYFKMAQKCADSGQYDKAADLCKKALDIDNTAVRPYFILSHIAEMKGSNEDAKTLLKRVIYLSPAFTPAYLELGALYERENDAERAKRMRITALDLLKALPPESVIEPYEGITAGELLEYVKKLVAEGLSKLV